MDEDRQGVYVSSALAGILVVLSLVLLPAVGQYGLVGDLTGVSSESDAEGSEASSGGVMSRILAPSDDELRAAASDYVMAFDYEGSDGGELRAQVEPEIIKDAYYGTDGDLATPIGESLDESEREVRYERELRDIEVESKDRDGATVQVTYEEEGHEEGESGYLILNRETLELGERDGEWRVASVTNGETLQSKDVE